MYIQAISGAILFLAGIVFLFPFFRGNKGTSLQAIFIAVGLCLFAGTLQGELSDEIWLSLYTLIPTVTFAALCSKYKLVSQGLDIIVSADILYIAGLLFYNSSFPTELRTVGILLQALKVIYSLSMSVKYGGQARFAESLLAVLMSSVFFAHRIVKDEITAHMLVTAGYAIVIVSAFAFRYLKAKKKKQSEEELTVSQHLEDVDAHYPDFESALKGLGFDGELIREISRKCNTDNNHMAHVAEYTHILCTAMGFSARKTKRISDAALIHDIGKLKVPDEILFKSEKLTEEEVSKIKEHGRYGYEILTAMGGEFFDFAADVSLQHHENIDGSGNVGKRGDDISIAARIIAVADVFDALTAPRPYKKPWDFESAFAYVIESGGSKFDSNIVKEFENQKTAIHSLYKLFYPQNV